MKTSLTYLTCLTCLLFIKPPQALSAPSVLTYKYGEQAFDVRPSGYPRWKTVERTYSFRGVPVVLPPERTTPGKIPQGVEVHEEIIWNREAIRETLESVIAAKINHDRGTVRISRTPEGNIAFDGAGFPGRKVESALAAELTLLALEKDIGIIWLPVVETPPIVLIEDETLKTQGISELVTMGESDFTGSPANRKHNIGIGLSKFNGHLIAQGEEFSFNAVLGAVNSREGYRKELTILGERTIPDFGGGLCQVSTTAYRGVWKAGFPILKRRNHSFAVIYYYPPGTDATIYSPIDMSFQNDSPGSLLIQTLTEGNKAYFFYYGTPRTNRTVELIGPFTWDVTKPPEDRTMYTTEIPPGETRIVSKAVPGMRAMWYRSLTDSTGTETFEPFFSFYEARPNIEEIGVSPDDPRLVKEIAPDRSGEER
jgi:vancomycin resistance protein YoaR